MSRFLSICFLFFSCNILVAQNDWTIKATFGGINRYAPCSFSIGNKGYMCLGMDVNSLSHSDLWEYDPLTNSWTEKKPCPAPSRYAATSFVIGTQVFICFGIINNQTFSTDLWMYDASQNSWTRKKSFPGKAKYGACAFTIGSKAYVGTGNQGSASGPFTNEFWEYDAAADEWTRKADLPGQPRFGSAALTINNRGYMGMGGRKDGNIYTQFNDWYEYIPENNSWIRRNDLPAPGRSYPAYFTIDNDGFVGNGLSNSKLLTDFWKYSPNTDQWEQVAYFKGDPRYVSGFFSIDDKGYVGLGLSNEGSFYSDFWEYGPPIKNKNSLDATFSFSKTICVDQELTFTSFNESPDYLHTWYFGTDASPISSNSINPQGIIYKTSGTKKIMHIVSDGVNKDSVTYSLNVNPVPHASFFFNEQPLCNYTPLNFINTGSTGSGFHYKWDFDNKNHSLQENKQNPEGIVYESGGTKTIKQTITSDRGCTVTNVQTIFINESPKAITGKNKTLCTPGSIALGSAPVQGNTYQWSSLSPLNNTQIANPIAIPLKGKNKYSLVVTNDAGCTDKNEITITLLDEVVAYAGVNHTICEKDSIQLGSSPVIFQRYLWTPPTGLSNPSISNPVAKPSVTTTYSLTVIPEAGCPAVRDEVTIFVQPLLTVDAGLNDSIDAISSTHLKATGGLLYTWSPSEGLTDIHISDPIASPTHTTTYVVTTTNDLGCSSADSVTIFVSAPNVWIPNSFTPNDDGHNDVFYIKAMDIENFELRIFNKWGEPVFYSSDINHGWNGIDLQTHQELPAGTYVFLLQRIVSSSKHINLKGIVNLIR
ncbi:MAG TPA: gliding motility-associated C-terminal domain-containing protein [Bacteroidia bacterium]|nr:gliding motility-associated C-terminal domain-containing protein [Bacteroidia bacterium]